MMTGKEEKEGKREEEMMTGKEEKEGNNGQMFLGRFGSRRR
jgi:hypothetical protein